VSYLLLSFVPISILCNSRSGVEWKSLKMEVETILAASSVLPTEIGSSDPPDSASVLPTEMDSSDSDPHDSASVPAEIPEVNQGTQNRILPFDRIGVMSSLDLARYFNIIRAKADGNCMFRALAQAMYGLQDPHGQCRLDVGKFGMDSGITEQATLTSFFCSN